MLKPPLIPLLVARRNNGPIPVTTLVATPRMAVNLTGVYTLAERAANGTTSENRVELIDNNGTLSGSIRQTKVGQRAVDLAPVRLTGTRHADGKTSAYSFLRDARVVTHTLTVHDAGGLTIASDDSQVVSTTLKKIL